MFKASIQLNLLQSTRMDLFLFKKCVYIYIYMCVCVYIYMGCMHKYTYAYNIYTYIHTTHTYKGVTFLEKEQKHTMWKKKESIYILTISFKQQLLHSDEMWRWGTWTKVKEYAFPRGHWRISGRGDMFKVNVEIKCLLYHNQGIPMQVYNVWTYILE